ncbi:unnamed protein product, partial [Ixodes pacificus]
VSILHQCIDVVNQLLVLSGDVEENPGHYKETRPTRSKSTTQSPAPRSKEILTALAKIIARQEALMEELKSIKTSISVTDAKVGDLSNQMIRIEKKFPPFLPSATKSVV